MCDGFLPAGAKQQRTPHLDVRVVVDGEPSGVHLHIFHEHQFNGGRPWEHSFVLQEQWQQLQQGHSTATVLCVQAGCSQQAARAQSTG